VRQGKLHGTIRGVHFPYQFGRALALAGEKLHVRYALTNLSGRQFQCMWAMHPLLAATPGMRVVLPAGAQVRLDSAAIEWFGWPYHAGEDISMLRERHPGKR
jgi:hypothetical protein